MGQVTIGGTTFEIYGTRTAAINYMKARLGADAWNSASSSDKDRALVSATRKIDRENWIGDKTAPAPGQPLEFPRTGLIDKDGVAVGSVNVPLLVEEANYELALVLLDDATKQDSGDTSSNTKRVKAGSAEVEFFRQTAGHAFPDIIQDLIGLWLDGLDFAGSGNADFGTDGCSTFDDIDQWGRTRGFP